MPEHDEVRQGDEYFCPKCGKRWGVDEPPPPCEVDNADEDR